LSFLIFFYDAIGNTFALRSEQKVTEKLQIKSGGFLNEGKTKIT